MVRPPTFIKGIRYFVHQNRHTARCFAAFNKSALFLFFLPTYTVEDQQKNGGWLPHYDDYPQNTSSSIFPHAAKIFSYRKRYTSHG